MGRRGLYGLWKVCSSPIPGYHLMHQRAMVVELLRNEPLVGVLGEMNRGQEDQGGFCFTQSKLIAELIHLLCIRCKVIQVLWLSFCTELSTFQCQN
jgi:hypothetical protein